MWPARARRVRPNAGPSSARLWKNGRRQFLANSEHARAEAVAVSGQDVYVAGWREGAGASFFASRATVWKNGVSIDLTDGQRNAAATAIAIQGKDVYVAGYESDEQDEFQAKVWKNGKPIDLGKIPPGYVTGVAVDGQDLYLLGRHALWKNGQPMPILGESQLGYLLALAVKGGKVFVAGWVAEGAHTVATVWVDGKATHPEPLGFAQIQLGS